MKSRRVVYSVGVLFLVLGLLIFLAGLYTAFINPLSNVPPGSDSEVIIKNQKFTINSIGIVTVFIGMLVLITGIILIYLASKKKVLFDDKEIMTNDDTPNKGPLTATQTPKTVAKPKPAAQPKPVAKPAAKPKPAPQNPVIKLKQISVNAKR